MPGISRNGQDVAGGVAIEGSSNVNVNSKGVVISPGPSNPFNAGECLDLVHQIYSFIPILGVCLGHQILGVYFGAKIDTLSTPMHGKVSNLKKNK